MKNELSDIVTELQEAMNTKMNELMGSEDFNAHSQGKINNVNIRIENLESAIPDIVQNFTGKAEVSINFKRRANEIRNEIEELTC